MHRLHHLVVETLCVFSVILLCHPASAQESAGATATVPVPTLERQKSPVTYAITLEKQGKVFSTITLQTDSLTKFYTQAKKISTKITGKPNQKSTQTCTLEGDVALRLAQDGRDLLTATADKATVVLTSNGS